MASASNPSPDPPMAFAVMRNSHEAFRAAIKEMESILTDSANDKSSFAALWTAYWKNTAVHMDMEEYDVMPLLDGISGGEMSKSGLHEMHKEEEPVCEDILSVVRAGDWEKTLTKFQEWKAHNLHHFELEEKLWMPLTQKVAPTPAERAAVVQEKVITPADKRNAKVFTEYLAWCVHYLSRFGSTSNSAQVATTVFVRAVHAASSAEQWSRYMPALRAACVPEVWAEIQAKFNIEKPKGHSTEVSSASVSHQTVENKVNPVKLDPPFRPDQHQFDRGCCVIS